MPSWARDSSVKSWYFYLLAVLCFGVKRFHKAAVLIRYLEVKFPFQTRIQFLKEMLCLSIFLITLHNFFFTLFFSSEHSMQKGWAYWFSPFNWQTKGLYLQHPAWSEKGLLHPCTRLLAMWCDCSSLRPAAGFIAASVANAAGSKSREDASIHMAGHMARGYRLGVSSSKELPAQLSSRRDHISFDNRYGAVFPVFPTKNTSTRLRRAQTL